MHSFEKYAEVEVEDSEELNLLVAQLQDAIVRVNDITMAQITHMSWCTDLTCPATIAYVAQKSAALDTVVLLAADISAVSRRLSVVVKTRRPFKCEPVKEPTR